MQLQRLYIAQSPQYRINNCTIMHNYLTYNDGICNINSPFYYMHVINTSEIV